MFRSRRMRRACGRLSGLETSLRIRSLVGYIIDTPENLDFGSDSHVLLSYLGYYNRARTHLALCKDAPILRTTQSVFFSTQGTAFSMSILGQGGDPLERAWRRSAMPRSAR